MGDDGVRRRVEGQADMGAGNIEVVVRVPGHAVPPIDNTIIARVDRSFQHCVGYFATQRIEKIAGAATRVAGGQHALPVLGQNLFANVFSGAQNSAMRDRATKRRGESNYRRDVIGSLVGYRAHNDAAQAVADQVDLALRLHQSLLDVLVQAPLDQDIGAVSIQPDAGKVRAISNAFQPGAQLRQIVVGPQEARNDDHT